jgi:hypothetical protein
MKDTKAIQSRTSTAKIHYKMDGNSWAMFLFLPVLSLYNAVKNIRAQYAVNSIWLFCGYFGLTFVIAAGSNADSSRIAAELGHMYDSKLTLDTLIGFFYNPITRQLDIVQSLILFIVSRFTDSAKILYAAFGMLFGYFYSRNIGYIVHQTNTKDNWFAGLLLVSFALVIPVWYINGFRYYMAAQVFTFGLLPFLFEGKTNRWFFVILSVLIHWSFFIAIGITGVYILLRNRIHLYYLLFAFTFFISILNLDIIRTLFESYAPAIIQESRSGYLNEAYQETVSSSKQGANWYVSGHFEALKWLIFVLVGYLYFYQKKRLTSQKGLFRLFNFSLLFFAFINLFSVAPSMGRFYVIPVMLFLGLFYLVTKNNTFTLPVLSKQLSTPILLLFIIVRIRIGFDYAGAMLIFGNPILAAFISNETPLIAFIKMIL